MLGVVGAPKYDGFSINVLMYFRVNKATRERLGKCDSIQQSGGAVASHGTKGWVSGRLAARGIDVWLRWRRSRPWSKRNTSIHTRGTQGSDCNRRQSAGCADLGSQHRGDQL